MIDRSDPPLAAGEAETLVAWLDYQRDTFRMKTADLEDQALRRTHPPSSLTLAGLTKHLALVEDWWFSVVLLDHQAVLPWRDVDWDGDPDWEFRTALEDSGDSLRTLYEEAVRASRQHTADVLGRSSGLDTLSVRPTRDGAEHFTLRWIMLHMIEEYARHNGHADLIRESIDGQVGE